MKKAKERSGRLTAAARRAQLIEVGRSVFAEGGYEATSVEEIAARAAAVSAATSVPPLVRVTLKAGRFIVICSALPQ